MSERWKYQIKTGLPFGLVLPILMTLMDWWGSSYPLLDAFISQKFLIKLIVFGTCGIFIIGYANWREKQKNEMYNKN